jgi:hypothetical protein
MSNCPKCGHWFEKTPGMSNNRKLCPDCTDTDVRGLGLRRKLDQIAPKLKIEADCSGNPKVWTSAMCSQEFLRTLIPG